MANRRILPISFGLASFHAGPCVAAPGHPPARCRAIVTARLPAAVCMVRTSWCAPTTAVRSGNAGPIQVEERAPSAPRCGAARRRPVGTGPLDSARVAIVPPDGAAAVLGEGLLRLRPTAVVSTPASYTHLTLPTKRKVE